MKKPTKCCKIGTYEHCVPNCVDLDANGYLDASFFWKQFVVVDDNEFPYTKKAVV